MDVLIASEDVIATVTKEGYVKRTSLRSFMASNGEPPGMKEGDRLLQRFDINTTDTLLLFTKQGYYLYVPVHQLPDIRWKDNGQHIANLVSLESEDEIIEAISVKNFSERESLLFITRNGMAKRSQLALYQAQRYSKPLMALKLKGDDELVTVMKTDGQQELFLATYLGYGLWFSEEEVSLVGQRAAGVKAINLKDGDKVIEANAFTLEDRVEFIVVTHRGAVKKISITEFDKSSRAKRGLVMLRELKSNPHRLVACKRIHAKDDSYVIQSSSGRQFMISPSEYRSSDRYSNGSFVIDTTTEGEISDVWQHFDTSGNKN